MQGDEEDKEREGLEKRIGEACRGRRERINVNVYGGNVYDGVGELLGAVKESLRRRVGELDEDGWMFEGGRG
jgi:hypothetical protein